MKRKYFFVFLNYILCAIECTAKYSIRADDSVNVQNCDLEAVRNLSELHVNPEEIIVQNCHIDELPNALFIRFQKLRILEITESQLRVISDFAFNGLGSLQVLNLARNNLTSVKSWSDAKHDALLSLDLRRNSISSVHTDAFKNYPNLLKLNLAVNHISEIPDELFRCTPLLKTLNLGKNSLKAIDSYTMKHLHKLIHLELKHNQIEFIESDSFVGNTHLKTLHLQENLLKFFDQQSVSNMPRLHQLNLSHNFLDGFINETFVKNEELVSLDISYNRFANFTEYTFKGLEVLEVLNASHNEIKFIDSTVFKHFAFLKYLDLSNNQLTSLPDRLFNTTTSLVSIKLNNNSLESIDDAVFSDLKLKLLDLSCNWLSNDNFLWTSVDIEYLNLTWNEYKRVNISVLDNIVTDLWGNPFICEWLVKEVLGSKHIRLGRNYVVDSTQNILRAEGIQCYDDDGTNAQRLIVVPPKNEENGESENLLTNLETSSSQPSSDEFEYRWLLWFLSGCLGVFVGLRVLKCLLNKSEKKSERYRITREQFRSMDDESKISFDMIK